MKNAEQPARRPGKPAHPLKFTVTKTRGLSEDLKFWHHGGDKVAYTTDAPAENLRARLGKLADVVSTGEELDFGVPLDDLGNRGICRLLVEGGSQVHTAFLSQNLADEIHLVVAPLIVGQADAPAFSIR